ncbi:hypothetical protein BD626DRAFT_444109 [Schizophyllum amplum]|uniref:Uncharacterized protein n=1 Tax=Schizophyllum amplum TaxID=97359 RepID=A0A550BSA4_9AGAR|nr:hypothetical protein BD626DRAFT_444109 [Auriculariopsis ampla]
MEKLFNSFKECFPFRTTRTGAKYSAFYSVNNPAFDLDQLYANAIASQDQDEADVPAADAAATAFADHPQHDRAPSAEDAPSNHSSPLSSLPSSRAPSPHRPSDPPVALEPPIAAKRKRPSQKPKAPKKKKALAKPLYPPPPPPAPSPDLSGYHPIVGGASQAKKRRSRTNRAKNARRSDGWIAPELRPVDARHLERAKEEEVNVDLLNDMPVTSTAFTAKREDGETKLYTREELVNKHGMRYCEWDGETPTGIVSPDGRTFAVLAGKPKDPEWDSVAESLAESIAAAADHITFPSAAKDHRRGKFGAQAQGVSHGGGQTEPANLKHTVALTAVLAYLVALPAMIRVAHFASSAFACWAPRLFAYYAQTMLTLFTFDPSLERNFPRSIFACLTINFGPRTVTYRHRDFGNLPFGWCAITALGKFNPDLGGDLVLWECGLVVRFPPGSTVLIPSAIINHSNTVIGREETRYSVTQYSSGALFRWVEHGCMLDDKYCMLDDKYYASLSCKDLLAAEEANEARWKNSMQMWSTMDELKARARDIS